MDKFPMLDCTRFMILLCSVFLFACGSAQAPAYPPPNDVALEDSPLWDKVGGDDEEELEEDDDWVDPGEDEDDEELTEEAAPTE